MAGSAPGDALILFGATGDLSRKKLLPALYELEAADRVDVPVIGVARSAWDDQRFRTHAREAIDEYGSGSDDEILARLLARLLFERLVGLHLFLGRQPRRFIGSGAALELTVRGDECLLGLLGGLRRYRGCN